MKQLVSAAALVICMTGFVCAEPAEPERQILGVRLEMSKQDVGTRLKQIGSFARDERKGQQIWTVNDASFSHVIVGFDKSDRLRFVTAVAREDKEAKRIAYREIGDLERARQAGNPLVSNFNYEWELPSEKGSPHLLVIARGRDPEFLSIYALKRLEGDSAAEAESKE